MSEWKDTELGEYADLLSGYAFKSIDFEVKKINDEYLPIIKIKNVANGDVNLNDVVYHKKDSKLEKFINEKGDILIAMTGNHPFMETQVVGSVSKYNLDEKSFLNQRVGKLFTRDEKRMDNDFLYYLLKVSRYQSQLASFSSGSASQANISKNDILGLIVRIPGIQIQKQIAKTLSNLDSKISLLRQQNETLEELAQTLFNQLLLEENQEVEVSLEEIAKIGIGRTPPRKEDHWFSKSSSDIKWISIKDLGLCDVFINNTSEYLTKEAITKFSIPIIPKNTVVLSFKMTLGRVAITTEEMLSNEAIAHFKIKDESLISTEYLYFFLKTYKYQNLGSTSSIVTSINSGMIKNIDIVIPKKGKMLQFTNSVKPLFNTMKSNSEQIDTLTILRDTLLPKLMNGELTIQ